MSKKFILTRDGEKVKLYKGKIKFKDRSKVIPGFHGVSKLRKDLKELKSEKIKSR